jgi:hypothetical protein
MAMRHDTLKQAGDGMPDWEPGLTAAPPASSCRRED